METLREILGLSFDDEARRKYDANAVGKRISEVVIDGVSIRGFSAFSFVRKLSYVKSPERSSSGEIGNLDSYPTFVTPQLQIDFSLLFIDSYRAIMNLIYNKREHLVECYDIVQDRRVTEKMYFEPEELPKLWTVTRKIQGQSDAMIELLGVQDYTVAMVGTNVPTSDITVAYYTRLSDGSYYLAHSEGGVENIEFLVGSGISVENSYFNGSSQKFNNSWIRRHPEEILVDESQQRYISNQAYRLVLQSDREIASNTIYFVAEYVPTSENTLVLNYGIGEVSIDKNGNQITSMPFVVGATVGETLDKNRIVQNTGAFLTELPASKNPTIKEGEYTYTTHIRQGWYFTSQIGFGSTKINNNTRLDIGADIVLYQIFEPVKNSVSFESNGGTQYTPLQNVSYGSPIALPTPYREGYYFVNWYTDSNFDTVFSGSMPPYPITLYAKWEKTNDKS